MQANKNLDPETVVGSATSSMPSILEDDSVTSSISSVLKSVDLIKMEGTAPNAVQSSSLSSAVALEGVDIEHPENDPDCPKKKEKKYGYCELTLKNYTIMITNIRHFKNLVWLLIFQSMMVAIAFGAIAYKLVCSSEKSFAIVSVYAYILPSSLIEIILMLVVTTSAYFRFTHLGSDKLHKVFLNVCRVKTVHYIVMLITVSVMFYFSLSQLRDSMQKELDLSMEKDVTKLFADTQTKRQCCGIDIFNDWNSKFNGTLLSFNEYPESCCLPISSESTKDGTAICSVVGAWTVGCYNIEYNLICWYCGWYISLSILGFFILAATVFKIAELYRYLQLYAPMQID